MCFEYDLNAYKMFILKIFFFWGGGHHKLRDIPNHLTVINYPSSNLPKRLSCKESTCQCRRHRDVGSIPGSWRSSHIGNGNLLQHSCLKNFMDREEPGRPVHGGHKSQTWQWLRTHTHIPRRNMSNLRYADDTTLMAESKEELQSLLIKVK